MTVAASCRGCGAEPRADARFCDACGTPLGHVNAEAEYKQVTVLFADVVHSMDIAAVVGAERLREIMTELFDRSSAVVLRYGGTVDKFTGDGLMAVFGAPVALEDHALRACLAALDIQREAQRIATEVEQRDHGLSLLLRIGLNSGAVIAGEIGSGRLNYTAVGEQVGFAPDLAEANAAIDRLAAVPTDLGFVLHELPLLRLRALLARAHGDEVTYEEFRDRYRSMAESLGFEGHIAIAHAMS